uniref:Uncharacterized protein n=1 Tax=viral metagenome TaxID=1070528 RepID=A0A6C0B6Q9_9ZZZZ
MNLFYASIIICLNAKTRLKKREPKTLPKKEDGKCLCAESQANRNPNNIVICCKNYNVKHLIILQ